MNVPDVVLVTCDTLSTFTSIYYRYDYVSVGMDSVTSTATRNGLDGPGIESQ